MKILQYIGIIALLVLVGACDEGFDDVNTNPNQPEEVAPSAILPQIIRSAVNASVDQSYLVGNNIMQLTAKTLRVEVDIYNWNAFANITWFPMYESLRNVVALEEIAKAEEHQNYEAIALIMKSWIFSVLTDAYGDIPYYNAIAADRDINFPQYDAQEDIYLGEGGLLANLERASSLLNTAGQSVEGDILYSGDIAKWQKFANSLRLRLLMRISDQQPTLAREGIQQIVNSGIYMQTYEDNAVLEYLNAFPNQFPLIPLKTGDFDAVNIGARAVEVLKELNDPRLTVYARPENAPLDNPENAVYEGLANGSGDADQKSRLGYIFYDYPGHQTVADKADGIIMTNAETQFILAEAAQKDWISGEAEEYYKSGVESNMNYWGVSLPYTAADGTLIRSFEEYYAQAEVDFAQAENKLERIGEQKWLALYFSGLEAWFDWRRTGYPKLEPTPNNENNDRIPVRFIYPGQEQNLNNDNYQDAISSQGADNINTKMWLLEE
ncbi:SusD/RagB family nutrient-binding outer membrane lipoprotein [Porifericola rhodea]|uniref:SusD/RagB family nutrient-binding outer membrane lipoprotein n=1 Tax=Porifericola rhodea TaxID=930972 RepID=UPI0026663B27|nr:SusD/RagB family nutrient-binding outer membrane lipoprotein [Porifericola rhodea]WKN30365.1 SusD/RagB family nutrient-binding outer membrane lipoprotein [Porifericola rhodea]